MIATVDGVNYRGCGGMVSVATTGRAPSPTLGRSKRRLSQFACEASCNQEETGGLEQGLDDEALAVVAER